MPGTAAKIRLSEKQQDILDELSRSRTVGLCVAQRASIIFAGVYGVTERGDAGGVYTCILRMASSALE